MSPQTPTLRRRAIATTAAVALLVPIALATTPAAAATTAVLGNFDDGAIPGQFFYGAAGGGVEVIADTDGRAKPGQVGPTGILNFGWNVTEPGSFGGYGVEFDEPIDFSVFDGVRFSYRGADNPDAQFRFELFDGTAGAATYERFDVQLADESDPNVDNLWVTKELTWDQFTRAGFQNDGAPNDGLQLDLVQGFAIPALAGNSSIALDDIELFSADDLTPTARVASSTATVVEGGTATVDVALGFAAATDVTVVATTADGTATAGDDYAAVSETVTIAAGATRASVSIPTVDDALDEGSETFTVTLSDPSGATLGSPTTATVTIIDNDGEVVGPPTGRTQLVDDMEAPLNQGRDGTIDIGWLQATGADSTMSYGQSTTPPAPVPGAADGNTTLRGTFDIGTFGVVVRAFPNETLDEWVPQDWSTFQGIGFWMYGNGTGTDLFIDVVDNRNPDSTRDDGERFSVAFEDDWTGWKFLTFDFDDFLRKEIGNGAPNDGFTLTEVHGYAIGTLRTPGEVTYYVDDVLLWGEREPAPLAVAFDRAGYEVTEGDDAVTTVRLNRVSDTDVTVDWSAFTTQARTLTEDLPATEGEDFVAASGTVTIPAGEREASISVETMQNDKWEVDETFVVALSNPVGAEFGMIRTAAVSIQDDDERVAGLVDDFESTPWLLDVERGARIDIADAGGAYPGADTVERVLDIANRGTGVVNRPIEGGQDWSQADGLSFWVNTTKPNQRLTVGIADNGAPDGGPDTWELAWSDEFDGAAGERANPENWTYETGGWGWGNDELQYYTDSTDNAALDGEGNLRITVNEIDPATTELQCWYGPCEYTSARLITENKQEFEYGRMETRVLVPQGSGIWPAVWTLGNDFRDVGWPQTGEIDIMEFVGRLPNEIFGTIHGPGYSGGQSFGGIYDFGTPVYDDWHTFTVEWTPERIDWFVDGIQYHTASPADLEPNEWVFDHPFTLLTNVAVGGNFGGQLGDDLEFPQSLLVDYIRVYQAPDTAERFTADVTVRGTGWQKITVPFDDFDRARQQPAGAPNDGLTLSDVQGYSLELRGTTSLQLDRVMVE